MATDIAEIEAKIRTLSPEDKAQLLRALIVDLDGPAEVGAAQAWIELARQRYQELTSGSVRPVSGEEVFAHLRACLQR